MNLSNFHSSEKAVSATSLFKGEGQATTIQILANQELKEHSSKAPALLICVSGKIIFENEKGIKETLHSGDYIDIEPLIKHWIIGKADSQLILLK